MVSSIRNIYDLMLKNATSLEAVKGSIEGMILMYEQDKLPSEEIKELEIILEEIKYKIDNPQRSEFNL